MSITQSSDSNKISLSLSLSLTHFPSDYYFGLLLCFWFLSAFFLSILFFIVQSFPVPTTIEKMKHLSLQSLCDGDSFTWIKFKVTVWGTANWYVNISVYIHRISIYFQLIFHNRFLIKHTHINTYKYIIVWLYIYLYIYNHNYIYIYIYI